MANNSWENYNYYKIIFKKFTFIGKLYSRFLFYKCKENDIFKDKSKWNLSIQNITHGLPFSGDRTPSVGLSHLMKFTASTDKGVVMITADMRESQHKQHEVCIDVCFITNTIHMTKKVYLLFLQCQRLNPSPPIKSAKYLSHQVYASWLFFYFH